MVCSWLVSSLTSVRQLSLWPNRRYAATHPGLAVGAVGWVRAEAGGWVTVGEGGSELDEVRSTLVEFG